MTITEERVQAEVAAEIRRIEWWNQAARPYPQYLFPLLSPAQVRSLADHLVRNRLQVEMGVEELRSKGRALGQEALHHTVNCKVTGGCYLCQAERLERQPSPALQALMTEERVLLTSRAACGEIRDDGMQPSLLEKLQ